MYTTFLIFIFNSFFIFIIFIFTYYIMAKKTNKLQLVILLLIIIIIVLVVLLSKKNNKNNKNNHKNNNEIKKKFRNFKVQDKYYTLVKYIGEANIVELDSDKYVHSITWQSPLDKYNGQGKYGGLDYIKLSGYITRKYHPIPADCFVIVGKYMNVPNHLMGPIKYASETINIEQLFIPQRYIQVYEETGKKEVALVTGSCASITISAITIKFVEDMIMKYKDNLNVRIPSLYKEFRNEYDNRVLNYLCGGGTNPAIPWYSADFFGEEETWTEGDFPQCMNSPGVSNLKETFNHSNNKNTCSEYENEDGCPPPDCTWEEGKCKAA